MSGLGLASLLALLGLLVVGAIRQVKAPAIEHRRPLGTTAEVALWAACAVLVLPRLVELLT